MRPWNMARFYVPWIAQTLFGQPCLVRRWGRIVTAGRTVQLCFEQEEEAVEPCLDLLQTKRRRRLSSTLCILARRSDPALLTGPLRLGSVPVGAGPYQLEAVLAFHLDQGGVDGAWEARIVQLDREVIAIPLV